MVEITGLYGDLSSSKYKQNSKIKRKDRETKDKEAKTNQSKII